MSQLVLGNAHSPLTILGKERRFPDMARTTIDCLRDGTAVTLHFWVDHCEARSFELKPDQPGLSLERRGLRIRHEGRGLVVRWCDVFMVATPDLRYLDPHRLYELPKAVATEMLANDEPTNRDSWEIIDSLRRAMASRPDGFNGSFNAPTFIERLDARASATARRLSELEAAEATYPDLLPPRPLAPGDFVIQSMPLHGPPGGWTVVECDCDLCALGRHVAVDQPFEGGWRHISRVALRRRGEVSTAQVEAMVYGLALPIGQAVGQLAEHRPALVELSVAFFRELAVVDALGDA